MKIMVLLKRKPGMTMEAFRAHYEGSHVVLAYKYLGHLMADYRRNYALPVDPGAQSSDTANPGVADSPFDCITELWLHDHNAWLEMQRIISDPVTGKIFMDDEEHFLDRPSLRIFACEEETAVPA